MYTSLRFSNQFHLYATTRDRLEAKRAYMLSLKFANKFCRSNSWWYGEFM